MQAGLACAVSSVIPILLQGRGNFFLFPQVGLQQPKRVYLVLSVLWRWCRVMETLCATQENELVSSIYLVSSSTSSSPPASMNVLCLLLPPQNTAFCSSLPFPTPPSGTHGSPMPALAQEGWYTSVHWLNSVNSLSRHYWASTRDLCQLKGAFELCPELQMIL